MSNLSCSYTLLTEQGEGAYGCPWVIPECDQKHIRLAQGLSLQHDMVMAGSVMINNLTVQYNYAIQH